MTLQKETLISAIAGYFALMAVAVLFAFSSAAHANPSYFANSMPLTGATSTPQFLLVGTAATTTLTYDTGSGISQSLGSLVLLQQFTGSSTSAVLTDTFEFSQNGIDWYSDDLFGTGAVVGTTTTSVNISASNVYAWTYTAARIGGSASTQTNNPKVLTVPIPTRFVRVVSVITGANGAVWEQFIGQRQNTE